MLLLTTLVLGALLLSTGGTAFADDGHKVAGGYFEEWSIYFANFNIANLQNNGVADKLTHLFYAFGIANSIGCSIADTWADYQTPYLPTITGPYTGPLYGNFAALLQLKQLHPDLKVLISLAGAPGFSAAAATDANRQAFVSSCIDLFINGNLAPGISGAGVFDGIDIDWEFPAAADTPKRYPTDARVSQATKCARTGQSSPLLADHVRARRTAEFLEHRTGQGRTHA
jgi:GH18 family chitinase